MHEQDVWEEIAVMLFHYRWCKRPNKSPQRDMQEKQAQKLDHIMGCFGISFV